MAFPLAPIALDNMLVGIFTALLSFLVAFFTARSTHKKTEQEAKKVAQEAEKAQVETEGSLRKQLADTDRRIGHLSHTLSDAQHARRQVEAKLYALEHDSNVKTAYVRAIGHWLNGLCAAIDSEWMEDNPKPRLPEEIRSEIESTASMTGLTVK